MDFPEAERKFNELQARVQRGEPLSEDQYQEELAKLMVQDDHGTFWSLEPGTGRWLYFDGTEWLPGTPPHLASRPVPPPPPPAASLPPASTAPAAFSAARSEPPGIEPEAVPTYLRAGENAQPGGIPPRPVREPGYIMPTDERPWLPFAIGAVVLLLCALVLFFGVGKLPIFSAAAVKTTPTEAPTEEVTPTEEIAVDATETPEVTATTAPAASPTASVVTATAKERINVRGGPGTSYAVLAKVDQGKSLTVIGRNADNSWLQVQLADGSTKGWASAEYLEVKGDVNSLPTASAPPPPAPTKKPTAKP